VRLESDSFVSSVRAGGKIPQEIFVNCGDGIC
jgi:hypothetical protein